MVNKVSLDDVVDSKTFSNFSKDYQLNSEKLNNTIKKITYLENEIKKNDDLDLLFQKYLDIDITLLFTFLKENPLLSSYIREKTKYDVLMDYSKRLVNSFDLDSIGSGNCKHVFGLMHNHYVCINCFLSENDLLIRGEEESRTFRDIVNKKERYAGVIETEELAYLDLIYVQHLKNNDKKILNRVK